VKVAIRDDDTCYFTKPADLERVYRGIWDQVPVCLATIPFAMGYQSPAVPRAYWTSGETFALERNPDLVAQLRERSVAGRVSIALHGYTHEDFPDGWEFQAAPDPDRRVREGLAYLRGLLGTDISIFVPPHNALSKAGMAAVRGARLNLLGSFLSFHPSRRPFELQTLPNWWRVQRFRARTGRTRSDPMVYPYPLRYSRHAEFGCHSLVPSSTLEGLVNAFEEARAAGGNFCVATHYWEVDDRLRAVLNDLLAHISRYPDVRFVKAEELFVRH
jgi:predicted deacetylase